MATGGSGGGFFNTAGNAGGASGGGMFGGGSAAQGGAKPATGMFASGGTLFGGGTTGQNTGAPAPATGSLFGGGATGGTTGGSGGLFSGAVTGAPAAGGNPPAAANPPAPTGTSTNPAPATGTGGSMFGGGTAGTGSGATAAFGSGAGGSGLFGGGGATSAPTGQAGQASGAGAPQTGAAPTNPTTTGAAGLFSSGTGAATAAGGQKPAGGLFSSTTTGTGTTGIGGAGAAPTSTVSAQDAAQEALLKNRYLSELMKEWKDSIKNQVEDFQSIAVDIRANEAELIKNHQFIYNMNQVHQNVQDEYKTIDEHLGKLELDQRHIETQLSKFHEELEKQNKALNQTEGRAATGTLVQKCKDLNEKITKVDQEVETIVTNFNNESHNPDKIDPENVPLNINLMLNHYFSILSNLEGETMLLTRKLQHLSDNHFSR